MTISKPGYYEISMADYLAGPAPEAELSSKIIGALWKQTPQRARMAHPKLNPGSVDLSPRADIGSAVHALAHGGYPVLFGDWKDWRTDASKAFRDGARDEQSIPLLNKDRLGVEAASNAVKMALAELGPGKHEQTMVWQYSGYEGDGAASGEVWCKGRADFLSDGPVRLEGIDAPDGVDCDTKTCDVADPVQWVKSTLYGSDSLDVQVALRHLGHIALTGKARKMLWLLAEYEHPYDTCFVGASDEVLELGIRKIKHAARIWRRCLDAKKWPGNPRKVVWAVPPQWAAWELENRGVP